MTPGGRGAAVAERPGLRIMRIVGSQYDATVGVEAWVAKAEEKIKVLVKEFLVRLACVSSQSRT